MRKLGKSYHVDKNVISKVILRGRLGDFSVHDSTNRRYRTIEYGLRRLTRTQQIVAARLFARDKHRYERKIPGELLHGDTKRLPPIPGLPGRLRRHEVLFIAIDDATRYLVADILPDKTAWSAAIFLDIALGRLPFTIEHHYSDNGGEYRGGIDHPFRAACLRYGIQQQFTKPYHPWTNGKAERVIKTLLKEWLQQQLFFSYEQRRLALYIFVDWYNHERPHMSLNNLTPVKKLTSLFPPQLGDNA